MVFEAGYTIHSSGLMKFTTDQRDATFVWVSPILLLSLDHSALSAQHSMIEMVRCVILVDRFAHMHRRNQSSTTQTADLLRTA